MRAVLSSALPAVAVSPVAVAVLGTAQTLAERPGRVTEVLIRPLPGDQGKVAVELRRLAAGRLDVRAADGELRLLSVATKPNRQSTALFSAIAVMIGFLLALNAMLLTVPERRRFVAELRMQGYDPRQIVLLLGCQALLLGLVASLAGVALGDALSRAFFQQVPDFLSAAFPIGAQQVFHLSTALLAIGCGVLATALASLSPLLDLRARRSEDGDGVFREMGSRSEVVRPATIARLGVAGVVLIAAVVALTLIDPALTILGGVLLALATLCLIPSVFLGVARWLPRISERSHSAALIVALTELRATTTRTVALAGIVGLAVYGGIAIGGARNDLLNGIGSATNQYFSTADVWVTSGKDVFNTNSFASGAPAKAIARAPGVASVRVYQGGLLDVGERRMWVRARPAGDALVLEPSQLLHGNPTTATRLIRSGGWAAVSSDYASEHDLHVGDRFLLATPSGLERVGVAAIMTNSGWPAGTITLAASDYRRWWQTTNAAALEVSLRPGISPAQGRRAVKAALGGYRGLQVRTAAEREAQSKASAREGLRTLVEISTLLLIAAALAVASALSATVWQRRPRLAALKIQGYDSGQLWRAVLLESAVTVAVGAVVGAVVGIGGHALASRYLQVSTGFPAPFSVGPLQVLLTIALIAVISLAVIALPGMAAARVPPRTILQE